MNRPSDTTEIPMSDTRPARDASPPSSRNAHGWTTKTVTDARSIIRRMLEDWPYQPPEVIEPELEAVRRWLEETKPEAGPIHDAVLPDTERAESGA
jgi:hypothetical protein